MELNQTKEMRKKDLEEAETNSTSTEQSQDPSFIRKRVQRDLNKRNKHIRGIKRNHEKNREKRAISSLAKDIF